MKKLLMATAFTLIGATAAQAEINLDIGLGEPAYVEPAPVYAQPVVVAHPAYYNEYGRAHHSRRYDYGYWNGHAAPHPVPHAEPHGAPHPVPHGNPHR